MINLKIVKETKPRQMGFRLRTLEEIEDSRNKEEFVYPDKLETITELSSNRDFKIYGIRYETGVYCCPMCGATDVMSRYDMDKDHDQVQYYYSEDEERAELLDVVEDNWNNYSYFRYCEVCCTIFDFEKYGSFYIYEGGHKNALLVNSFIYNDIEHKGSPYYKNIEEWVKLSPRVKIIDWYSPIDERVITF